MNPAPVSPTAGQRIDWLLSFLSEPQAGIGPSQRAQSVKSATQPAALPASSAGAAKQPALSAFASEVLQLLQQSAPPPHAVWQRGDGLASVLRNLLQHAFVADRPSVSAHGGLPARVNAPVPDASASTQAEMAPSTAPSTAARVTTPPPIAMPVGADTPEQSHLFFGGALDLSRGEPAAMRSVPDAITATPVRLSWHGELGPGLAVSIAVHADADPPAPANAPAARIWRARLRLELPQLGVIDAEVALRDNACAITCRAASTASAALLQNAAAELGGVLVDAGLRLERFAAHA